MAEVPQLTQHTVLKWVNTTQLIIHPKTGAEIFDTSMYILIVSVH